VAGAIVQALTMPLDERRQRHAALLESILENDVHKWQNDFLDALLTERRSAEHSRFATQTSRAPVSSEAPYDGADDHRLPRARLPDRTA